MCFIYPCILTWSYVNPNLKMMHNNGWFAFQIKSNEELCLQRKGKAVSLVVRRLVFFCFFIFLFLFVCLFWGSWVVCFDLFFCVCVFSFWCWWVFASFYFHSQFNKLSCTGKQKQKTDWIFSRNIITYLPKCKPAAGKYF